MTRIIWNESYSVGVSKLDQHHQHLATLINRLSQCSSPDTFSEPFSEVVSELVQYARYHFQHEEQLMSRHGYPHFTKHRAEHDKFCEIICETSYGATLGVISPTHLVDYLVRWWNNHILLEDMQFKPFFAREGLC